MNPRSFVLVDEHGPDFVQIEGLVGRQVPIEDALDIVQEALDEAVKKLTGKVNQRALNAVDTELETAFEAIEQKLFDLVEREHSVAMRMVFEEVVEQAKRAK